MFAGMFCCPAHALTPSCVLRDSNCALCALPRRGLPQIMAAASVITNAGLVAFTSDVVRAAPGTSGTHTLVLRFLVFLGVEHAVFSLAALSNAVVPDVPAWVAVIRQRHAVIAATAFGSDQSHGPQRQHPVSAWVRDDDGVRHRTRSADGSVVIKRNSNWTADQTVGSMQRHRRTRRNCDRGAMLLLDAIADCVSWVTV